MKFTFYDKLFIGVVLLLSLLLFASNLRRDTTAFGQRYIQIQASNRLIMEYSFDEKTEEILEFPFGDNEKEVAALQISEGKVRMLPMDSKLCPQRICSQTGWISGSYHSIVCVPNRIIVSFKDIGDYEVDGVTF